MKRGTVVHIISVMCHTNVSPQCCGYLACSIIATEYSLVVFYICDSADSFIEDWSIWNVAAVVWGCYADNGSLPTAWVGGIYGLLESESQ